MFCVLLPGGCLERLLWQGQFRDTRLTAHTAAHLVQAMAFKQISLTKKALQFKAAPHRRSLSKCSCLILTSAAYSAPQKIGP
eukprot:260063-Amphidinium_carterae.1